MTLYPEIIRSLLEDCRYYRQRQKDLAALKSAIWHAAEQITALEDRELRRKLQQAEGELDSIQFTTDTDKIFPETLKALDALEAILAASL